MKIDKKAWQRAWANQRLVRGALKHAHVRPDYRNYEDLLQEGIIVYAEMLTTLAELPQAEIDRQSFRKIIWRTIDLLRREQSNYEHQVYLENASKSEFIVNEANADTLLVLMLEVGQMPVLAQVLFYHHFILGKSITAIAGDTGISRAHLHRLKRKIQEKSRKLLAI